MTAEVVPILLRTFLSTVLQDAQYTLVHQVVQVMLERILSLYPVDG